MKSRDSVADLELVCILTISVSYDLHSHCGQNFFKSFLTTDRTDGHG